MVAAPVTILAFIYFAAPKDIDHPTFILLASLLLLCSFLLACALYGVMYTIDSDIAGMALERGDCRVGNEDKLDEQLKILYQLGSYPNMKTTWPVALMFSILVGIVITCFIDAPFSLKNLSIISLVSFVGYMGIGTFISAHSALQHQIRLDNHYCKALTIMAQSPQ